MINMSQDMEKPGLDDRKLYEATVVANDDSKFDGRKCYRVQVRVDEFFKDIPDTHLPWAIPKLIHVGGASADSGSCSIPSIGSKVLVRFQGGRPEYPMYEGYHATDKTVLAEALVNYPNRTVNRLDNGAVVVIDKTTDELFIYNPGAMKIHVHGNLELVVDGDVNEHVKGNYKLKVDGNYSETIGGSRLAKVGGSADLDAANIHEKASGAWHSSGSAVTLHASALCAIDGSMLSVQSHSTSPATTTAPVGPSFTSWPGIRKA